VSAPAYEMREDGTLARQRTAPLEPETRTALSNLLFLTGWGGGVRPLYRDAKPNPTGYTPATGMEAERTILRRLAGWHGQQVELGLPEVKRGSYGPSTCSCLWAWVETRDAAARAWRFRPRPTFVLKVGASCKRLLIWALEENVPEVLVVSANKRLAYALHSPQKWAQPEKLRIPIPGGVVTVGRKRPAPVTVTRNGDETYLRAQIVGRLRDPPPDYMQRLRNGEIKDKGKR
jgi:hypothetical protein